MIVGGLSRFKSHSGVSSRQISSDEYREAVYSVAWRITVLEGEVLPIENVLFFTEYKIKPLNAALFFGGLFELLSLDNGSNVEGILIALVLESALLT